MDRVSDKQLAANRRNAQKSTGPRSSAGKAVSRMNALQHGLTAEQVVLPDESVKGFEAFRAALCDEFDPKSMFEAALVDDIALLMWRLRRAHRIEVMLLKVRRAEHKVKDARKAALRKSNTRLADEISARFSLPSVSSESLDQARKEVADPSLSLGHAFLLDIASNDGLTKLSRYETTLRRNLERTLMQFNKAREARLTRGDDGVAATPHAGPQLDLKPERT